jgi:outer membrane receptor protein involved in Fe transport
VSWPTGWFKGAAVDAVTEDGRVIAGEMLGPEKLAATELGLRWQPEPWLALDFTAFQHDLDDLLGYTVYHASGEELNLGNGKTGEELMIRGLETELRTRFGQTLDGFLNHTYQDATITAPDGLESRWANAPRHKLSGGVRWHGPVVVDLRARWVDAVTYSEIPDAPVADYGTVDLAVSKVLARRLFLKFAVQNLLDHAHHEYPLYTQLVRKARLAVQYHF